MCIKKITSYLLHYRSSPWTLLVLLKIFVHWGSGKVTSFVLEMHDIIYRSCCNRISINYVCLFGTWSSLILSFIGLACIQTLVATIQLVVNYVAQFTMQNIRCHFRMCPLDGALLYMFWQVEREFSTLPSSGERLKYQLDPRPHFGDPQSSRSISFPLWDSGRLREIKEEEDDDDEDGVDSFSCCPHCHLGLPRDTLSWHEVTGHTHSIYFYYHDTHTYTIWDPMTVLLIPVL